jgi:two-component sensor histidine kinase
MTNFDGADVLQATGRSRASGWGVAVNVPYAVISQPLRNALLLWGTASIVAVALALGLGVYFARQVARSLSIASGAAVAFGRGESPEITWSRLVEVNSFLAALRDARNDLSKAQSHQKLLMRELQHRTQNLFAVILAIIGRSLTEEQSISNAKQVIEGRLQALARAHGILAGTNWEGAPLNEILKREFGEALSDAVEIAGCDVDVNASAAHQFALIIHELTTNALKHGALSVQGGRVSVMGTVEQVNGTPHFHLEWVESGGPPVEPPIRRGFGSVILIEMGKRFGMDIKLNYDAQGIRYELWVSMDTIAPSNSSEDIQPFAES